MSQEPNSSPSRLSDDVLAKMVSDARTTISKIPESRAEVTDRVSRFNELYEALPTKPDTAALMYRDPVTGSPNWIAIGKNLLIGRASKTALSSFSSLLQIHDDEMSRQHFEIVLTECRSVFFERLETPERNIRRRHQERDSRFDRRIGDQSRQNKFHFHRSLNCLRKPDRSLCGAHGVTRPTYATLLPSFERCYDRAWMPQIGAGN